ncbi:MAG: tetratricopeptide repeat protein [Vicinamibacterales bacterium]
MPIDRAATLRQAEKLLRQGKLDLAIGEYLRLVEEQPRDWNTGNLLGDLYVRAGQMDSAIGQFARIAESLHTEGFLSKAAALYKKILKLRPDDDRALVAAGELAAEQSLLADARGFLSTAITTRRARGDVKGALALIIRVGALDKGDVAARLAAADARHQLDDLPGAIDELNDLTTMLLDAGRDTDAVAPLRQLATLDPGGKRAPRELARILVQQGELTDAAQYLTMDVVADDPALMLVAADVRLKNGDTASGLEMVDTLLASDPTAIDRVRTLADGLVDRDRDTAFDIVDRVVSVRIAEGNWHAAEDVLRGFVERAPAHVPALTRLVEVCVDGNLESATFDAQGLLADAYLQAGAAAEAKYVAEDLVTRQPWERAHFDRLRAALAAAGEADPDRALANWLADTPSFGMGDEFRVDAPESDPAMLVPSFDQRTPDALSTSPASSPARAARPNPFAIDLDLVLGSSADEALVDEEPDEEDGVEEDLSGAIDTIPASPPPVVDARASAPTADIESVFESMREQATHRSPDEAADVAYARGAAFLEAGQADAAIDQLRLAMRAPARRFAAASLLARAYQQAGRTADAIEWLGHAVDVPGIAAADRFDTLHRLADLLESTGESASALAVCLELQADAGDFRDVVARIARLSRAQSGG